MKSIAAIVVLILIAAGSAYAQTVDFFKLVKTETPQAIQAAINQGLDPNAQDNDGLTPLMWAAERNQNPEVTTTLLKAGADVKAADKDGETALMHAAASSQENLDVINALLKAGAAVNARSKGGWTSLMGAAALNPNPEAITTLLTAGRTRRREVTRKSQQLITPGRTRN